MDRRRWHRGHSTHGGPQNCAARASFSGGSAMRRSALPANRTRARGRPGNNGIERYNSQPNLPQDAGRRGSALPARGRPGNNVIERYNSQPNLAEDVGKPGSTLPARGRPGNNGIERNNSQPNLPQDAGHRGSALSAYRSRSKGPREKNDTQRYTSQSSLAEDTVNETENQLNTKHVIYPMKLTRIEKLLKNNDPAETLLTLNLEDNGFFCLLRSSSKISENYDLIAAIICASGNASRCDHKYHLASFLNKLISETQFVTCILNFLVHLQIHDYNEKHVICLPDLLTFLQQTHRILPNASFRCVHLLLYNLKGALNALNIKATGTQTSEYKQCQEDLRIWTHDVEAFSNEFEAFVNEQSEVTDADKKKAACSERHQMRQPPNNFREIPIFPQDEDLDDVERPFLRKNIIEGRYENVEHYLDVQFRLLREDFIQPLREGISEYRWILSGKQVSRLHNKSIRVYVGVHVQKTVLQDDRMLHVIQFNTGKLKHVRWEASKRLLQGSLLCLSSDNFQTMLFATVAVRKVEDLAKGLVEIQFGNTDNDALKFDPNVAFTMVESEAYFEAYKHNLLTLQTFTEENFPLKDYIVNVDTDVGIPSYISTDIYKAFEQIQDKRQIKHDLCCVSDDEKWLAKMVETFDDSQMRAFKAALTKEFSVIQGPPGTGKTFIGLKIVQSLLQDLRYWNKPDRFPILLVCYTNHALDQFLEGVSPEKIVRIGGRCQNPELKQYMLREIREAKRRSKNISAHIHRGFRDCCKQKQEIKCEIKSVSEQIEAARKDIFNLSELNKEGIISERHAEQLQQMQREYNLMAKDSNVFHHWLEIHNLRRIPKDRETDTVIFGKQISYEFSGELQWGSDSEMEDYDVEYIQDMRAVDDLSDFEERYEIDLGNRHPEYEYEFVDDRGGWQIQGGVKKAQKNIRLQLQKEDMMTETEVENVRDVRSLGVTERWRLYRFWVQKFIEKKGETLIQLQKCYLETVKIYRELQQEQDFDVIRDAKIVGMTTTGAAKYRFLVTRLKPKIVVVEEAAEVLEAHIVTSLTKETNHLILIGDHQQLRPTTTVYRLAKTFHLDISLFERMIKNGMDHYTLDIQHRMRPCISSLLVPSIYPNLKDAQSLIDIDDKHVKGVAHDVFFVSHCFPEETDKEGRSFCNKHEAAFLVELCNHLTLQGYSPSQITILTMYSGQLYAIKKELRKRVRCKDVRATVVDNYQGEENDIILLSFVRSNIEAKVGFLKTDNRICVALSRAKRGMYCIGDFNMLSDASPLWKNILSKAEDAGAVGTSLALQCQNHPKKEILVCRAQDIRTKAPEGACTESCDFQLACGHACPKLCHAYDREHKESQCRKGCSKIIASCPKNHRCPKSCHYPNECPPCGFREQKFRNSCGHYVRCPCYMDPEISPCSSRCNKIFPCGHQCHQKCSEECETNCSEKIEVSSPCGHKVKIPCFKRYMVEHVVQSCEEPCSTILPCGHLCKGTCSSCYQKRLHKPCTSPCNRTLVCGHQCHASCAVGCPPCDRKCENRCMHSKCQKLCGEPCIPCQEKCPWSCKHKSCDRLCHEPCSRTPCDEPCEKLLTCGHQCIGLCGEPCPKKCRFCDHDEVTEIFFGYEDEPDARFVELEDCKHVIEVDALTGWMEQEDAEIQLKRCPKCKTPIRKNVRYKGIIRQSIQNIEKVKEKVRGSERKIDRLKKELLSRHKDALENNSLLQCYPLGAQKRRGLVEINLQSILVLLGDVLKSSSCLSLAQLTHYENYLTFFDRIVKAMDPIIKVKECNTDLIQIPVHSTELGTPDENHQITSFLFSRVKEIVDFVQKHFDKANEFLLKDVSSEIARLEYLSAAIQLRQKIKETSELLFNARAKVYYQNALQLLTKLAPFREEDKKIFKALIGKIEELTRTGVGISDVEKNQIVKAMNLSPGHWFECPNGHIYCITECGGAMEEGRCNECGARIGGRHHSLRSDNRHNSALDGSRFPAWSQQANIANFDLNELI